MYRKRNIYSILETSCAFDTYMYECECLDFMPCLLLDPYDLLAGESLGISLQHFAAEDEGRTFDPTEQKIRKAKEEGRVPKSTEIPSALILVAVSGLIWGLGSYYVKNLRNVFEFYIARIHIVSTQGFSAEMINFVTLLFKLFWPIALIVIAIAILGNTMQFGFVFSTKPISPDFSKVGLKFDKWFEKIFSIQGVYNTSMSIFKILVIGVILLINLLIRIDEISATTSQSFEEGLYYTVGILFSVLIQAGLFLLALGLIDYQFQRFIFMNQLKMTFQDVKEEFKESEGDAEVKRRIKGRMQEFLNRNVVQNVSDSDVLVTNPTHFAVALKFEGEVMEAPQVMAKGEDEMALRMRRIAKDADVPIIENKPLARALYADLEVGDEIPSKYYRAVSLIFKELDKFKEPA